MIISSLYASFGGEPLNWLNIQMEHVPWDGFHFMDLVFPLFLFIAGVSFPFSLEKRREKQEPESAIRRHLLKRALTLVALGLLYNGILRNSFENIRCASVLAAHIGLAWFFAAIIYMRTPKTIFIGLWIACLVVGYGLLNWLVLAPDAIGTNPFVAENNIVAQFDRWFLPGKLYGGNFDPEGLLSLIPATATALLGIFSGMFLNRKDTTSPSRKAFVLFVSGGRPDGDCLVVRSHYPFQQSVMVQFFYASDRRHQSDAAGYILLDRRCPSLHQMGVLFQGYRNEFHHHLYGAAHHQL